VLCSLSSLHQNDLPPPPPALANTESELQASEAWLAHFLPELMRQLYQHIAPGPGEQDVADRTLFDKDADGTV